MQVKIMGYSEGKGFSPSSAHFLNYSAKPRLCINGMLSKVYFLKIFAFANAKETLHNKWPEGVETG